MLKEIHKCKPVSKPLINQKSVEKIHKHESPDLSIIIPAYNEEKTISSIIKTVKESIPSYLSLYEIIIINDGSTDQTKEEAKKTEEKVIDLKKNSGKANALRIGFKASSGFNILTVDADGSHQKKDIEKLINVYFKNNIHMLIGSRFRNKIKIRFTSSMNIVGNKLFKYLLLLISGKYITDSQSGLRIFNRKVIQSIELISKGYEIESELTVNAIARGFSIMEIPITCKPRIYGSSRLNSLIDGFKIAKTIIYSYFQARKAGGRGESSKKLSSSISLSTH